MFFYLTAHPNSGTNGKPLELDGKIAKFLCAQDADTAKRLLQSSYVEYDVTLTVDVNVHGY